MTPAADPETPLDLKASLRWPLRIALGAGLLTALLSLPLPNYYKCETRILPADQRGSSGMGGQLAAAAAVVGVAIPGQEGPDAAYVDIINSRWMRKQLLLETYTYETRFLRFGPARRHQGTLCDYLGTQNLDRAIKQMGGILTVSRDLKSKLLTLSAETTSPELSQQVARKAVRSLEEFIQTKARTRGSNKAAFSLQRLAETRAAYAETEREFRTFLEQNRNYQTSAEPRVRLDGQRLESELKLRQQLVMTLSLAHEQALMEEKNDMPILNVLDDGDLPRDKSKPSRSILVLLMTLLAGGGTWLWQNRARVRRSLLADGEA